MPWKDEKYRSTLCDWRKMEQNCFRVVFIHNNELNVQFQQVAPPILVHTKHDMISKSFFTRFALVCV